MPGQINGRQLAAEMAKRRSPLKVLFTSGYTEDAIVHHGRLDPDVLLLGKPYRMPDLARMIRLALTLAGTVSGGPVWSKIETAEKRGVVSASVALPGRLG
jgi:hypothetical protein